MRQPRQQAIMVLGMHRSGTSALAGMLHHLGIDFGRNLVAASPGVNARGFWEHPGIMAVHDRVLESLGSHWHDVCPLPDQWWQAGGIAGFRAELTDILARDYDEERIWGIKDPRLARLLPLWHDVLRALGRTPHHVLILRDPGAVAASLGRRDGFEPIKSRLLWVDHLIGAERFSRGQSRVAVDYDRLLDDWRAAAAAITQGCGLDWPVAPDDAAPAIDDFLSPDLRHFPPGADDGETADWAATAYRAWLEAGDIEAPALRQALGRVAAAYGAGVGLCAPWLKRQEKRLDEVGRGFADALAALDQRDALLSEVGEGFKQAVEMLHARDDDVAAARARLAGLQADLAARDAEIAGLRQSIETPAPPAPGGAAKRYGGRVDLSDDNNSYSKMIALLSGDFSGAARILEVGCADGHVGAFLEAQGHRVVGVEPFPVAAAEAARRIGEVHGGTIEDYLGGPAAVDARFDYLLFGDVLEHLARPDAVLRQCRLLLGPDGAVIASIPNVAHVAVRAMLMEGRWDYADYGILDDTHLRFFTRDSLLDLFAGAGFAVERIEVTRLDCHSVGITTDPVLLGAARALVEDHAAEVFQFVVLARKAEDDVAQAAADGLRIRPVVARAMLDHNELARGLAEAHDAMQATLERQHRDLDELRAGFATALEQLAAKEHEVKTVRAEFDEISAGFANALRLLEARDQAASAGWGAVLRVFAPPVRYTARRLRSWRDRRAIAKKSG
jgi:2-polyprenyl-3-methyl-5-hydroxy-6-metoxy-1,4-benzoquinol methylase